MQIIDEEIRLLKSLSPHHDSSTKKRLAERFGMMGTIGSMPVVEGLVGGIATDRLLGK